MSRRVPGKGSVSTLPTNPLKKSDAVVRLERLLATRPDVVKATALRMKMLTYLEQHHDQIMGAMLDLACGVVRPGQTGDSIKAQAGILSKLIDKVLVSTADRPNMGPSQDAGNGPKAVIFNLNGCDGGILAKRGAQEVAQDVIDTVAEAVG